LQPLPIFWIILKEILNYIGDKMLKQLVFDFSSDQAIYQVLLK